MKRGKRVFVSLIDAALVGVLVACVLGRLGFYTTSRPPPEAYYGQFVIHWQEAFFGIFIQYLMMCLFRTNLNKARSTTSPISVIVHGVFIAVTSGFWPGLAAAAQEFVPATSTSDPLAFLIAPLVGCFVSFVACLMSLMFVATGFLYGRTLAFLDPFPLRGGRPLP
ncbi:hypothetical protein [Deinococcus hopiensis]|uniref:Uncharacterized protein n=1 Tax=Deinococcus hopiensis KR-140 TaxID=695939 RepID=A0A1W1U9S0_9DEIO|nr:hypothetical protein [Deinococcus hopiensis]SMB77825.1 hypothetical protein SAMN00790413_03944 [Deinococcus hopiensis KR-140]